MHACHMYAYLDQIDFSSLSDVMPSHPLIDVELYAEIEELNGDVEVLLERYVICDLDNIILQTHIPIMYLKLSIVMQLNFW